MDDISSKQLAKDHAMIDFLSTVSGMRIINDNSRIHLSLMMIGAHPSMLNVYTNSLYWP